jgi:hypothetical protein
MLWFNNIIKTQFQFFHLKLEQMDFNYILGYKVKNILYKLQRDLLLLLRSLIQLKLLLELLQINQLMFSFTI